MLYNNNNNENNNYNTFLDVIGIASFILQIQNRESNMIANMQNQLTEKLDKNIDAKLDKILKELQEIKSNIEV